MHENIFSRLTLGAKFDLKRFSKDADKLNPKKRKDIDNSIISQDKDAIRPEKKLLTNNTSSNSRLDHKEFLKAIEQVNLLRKRYKIHVYGTDIPKPIELFSQILEEDDVIISIFDNIKSLGYENPTPVQMQSLPLMLNRREMLVCAPTGSGKTAAFLIPLILNLKNHRNTGFRALIISPTRELSKQTYLFCKALTLGTNIIPHLLPKIGNPDCPKYMKNNGKYDIIITTPNRLNFLLNRTQPLISLSSVEWLIIDESDKLFETNFRDQVTTLYNACDSALIKRAMFSATYSHALETWCRDNCYNLVTVCVGSRNLPTDAVEQELYFAGSEAGKLIGLRNFIKSGWEPPVLIFVQSKERAKQLYKNIKMDGIRVDVIHADRPQNERDDVIKNFREGTTWTLICTDLLSRGIDFKDVNLVINYDFPTSAISYIHRIGRTGRAGKSGRAITFHTHEDMEQLRTIADVMKRAGCPVPEYATQIQKPSKEAKKRATEHAVRRPKIGSQKILSKRFDKKTKEKLVSGDKKGDKTRRANPKKLT